MSSCAIAAFGMAAQREGFDPTGTLTTKLLICHMAIREIGEFVLVLSASLRDATCPMQGLLR